MNDVVNNSTSQTITDQTTNPSNSKAAVWLAEGQSSQRDMLASLQILKSHSPVPFTIIASHRHDRPEIFEYADGYRS